MTWVCAYSFPTLYMRGLERQGRLSTVDKDRNRQLDQLTIRDVESRLPSTMDIDVYRSG
jgi:hypothetical protein